MSDTVTVWYCETHDAMGQHSPGEEDKCDVAQLVECQLGWPKRCVLRRMVLRPFNPPVGEMP